MADKKRVRKGIKQLQRIKTWQLVILLLLVGLVAATFLRLNNIGMVERRDAVKAGDETGDSDALKNRLYDLQRYVSAHMNTDPGKIALINSYQRDSQKAKEAAQAAGDNNPNGNVYQKAADVCDPIGKAQGWRWPDPRYIACVDTELSKYPATNGPVAKIELPDVNLYYHSFLAPVWSPDFAGWSLVICFILVVIIIGRLVGLLVLRLLLRRHYKAI